MTSEKVMVIGGGGFLGRAISETAARGGWSVCGLSRTVRTEPDGTGVEWLQADACDLQALRAAFDHFRPTAVVMSLSRSTPRTEKDVGVESLLTEVRALSAAAICCTEFGVEHVSYLSSAGTVYGETAGATGEEAVLAPRSTYGRLKAACEDLARAAFAQAGIPLAVLRISNPYGPGQDPDGAQGVVAIFLGRILGGREIQIFGESRKDYIFVGDVAAAVLAAAERRADGVFNIGSGVSTSLEELVDLMQALSGRPAKAERRPALNQDVQHVFLDVTRAEAVLGWRAAVSLDEGLNQTLAWLEARPA